MSIDKARWRWNGTDSTFEGTAQSWFQKRNGKHMVVLEDDRGLLHVYPMTSSLVPIDAKLSPAPVGEDAKPPCDHEAGADRTGRHPLRATGQ